jgi:hypothetical protein
MVNLKIICVDIVLQNKTQDINVKIDVASNITATYQRS